MLLPGMHLDVGARSGGAQPRLELLRGGAPYVCLLVQQVVGCDVRTVGMAGWQLSLSTTHRVAVGVVQVRLRPVPVAVRQRCAPDGRVHAADEAVEHALLGAVQGRLQAALAVDGIPHPVRMAALQVRAAVA
jgi:hypothetical protein